MTYYILDLEYNQYFDFNDSGRAGRVSKPEPALPAEIIQMGVVVADDKFNVKMKCETLVRPQIYRRLHPYVGRITGLNMNDLRDAPSFPDAFQNFFGFALRKKAVFATWGQDDLKELYKNIIFYGLNHRRLTRRFINVQRLYSDYLAKTVNIAKDEPALYQQVGLRAAVEGLGFPTHRPFHTALADAEYTGDILGRVLQGKKQSEIKRMTEKLDLGSLNEQILGRVNGVNIALLYKQGEEAFGRKLNDRDKAALLEAYNLGRVGKFDLKVKKRARGKGRR